MKKYTSRKEGRRKEGGGRKKKKYTEVCTRHAVGSRGEAAEERRYTNKVGVSVCVCAGGVCVWSR